MSSAAWRDLVAAAVVGVERRPYQPPSLPGGLGALLSRLPAAAPEHTLLAAAGLLATYHLAGAQPVPLSASSPPPCPPDETPRCTPAAGQHLALMLSGEYAEALPEWLAACAAAGRRAPEEHLPALLDLAAQQARLRPAITRVLGRRGCWLAGFNPKWEDLRGLGDPGGLETEWETAPRARRLSLLQELRGLDPAQALALLQSTWQQESAADRAAFVGCLASGLGPADEDFLEAVLDDRSKEVRVMSAGLLARLPGSRLVQRMTARAASLLRLSGPAKKRRLPLGPKTRLEVSLPKACDAALARDGVEPKPRQAMGERAVWLLQSLSAVPPAHWSRSFDRAPAELLSLAAETEWRGLLVEAWTTAAARLADAAWAEALLLDMLAHKETNLAGGLLAALPPDRREAFVYDYLKAHASLGADQPGRWLLEQYAETWSPRLTRLVVECASTHIRLCDPGAQHPGEARWLKRLARCLHPAALDEDAARLRAAAEACPWWNTPVEDALRLWRFRHAMLKEFTP